MHADEFNARKAFAYAVLNSEKDTYIGCVYINPTEQESYDCEVYLWVKDSEFLLDKFLFQSVENWLQEEWPFRRVLIQGVLFPGKIGNKVLRNTNKILPLFS